jgi:hypothetical protein
LETSSTKNSIDNESNSAQYLVVESLPLLQLGSDFRTKGPLQGKNCSRRKFMPAKKKAAKKKKH